MTEYIVVYTDGSCMNNQNKFNKKGGYGIFFKDDDIRNTSIKLTGDKITNQVAELTACIHAIELIKSTENLDKKKILIKTDSMYCINSITKWCKNWQKNNWKKSNGDIIENLDLMKKLYEYSITLNIEYQHIRAHKKEPNKNDNEYNDWYGNMMADKLATSASIS